MMSSNGKSSLDMSRLSHVLQELAKSSEAGIKSSQSRPRQLVESAFNFVRSPSVLANRILRTRATSLLLSSIDPPNILIFLDKASVNRRNSDKEMTEARKEVVIQLTRLFKADDTNLIFYKSFLPKVIDVCYQVLVREKKSASVRNKVFQLLFEILIPSPSQIDENQHTLVSAEEFKVAKYTNNVGRQSRPLYDLANNFIGRGAKDYGVLKGSALELLGRLYSVYPIELAPNRDAIFHTLLRALTGEYAKDAGSAKQNIVIGAIKGLSACIKTIEEVADGSTLLDIFPKEKEIEKLFTCIFKNSIIVQPALTRFGVPMAAIDFISNHAVLFTHRIVCNGEEIYYLLLDIYLSKDKRTLREYVVHALRAIIRVFNSEIFRYYDVKPNSSQTLELQATLVNGGNEDANNLDKLFRLVTASTFKLLQDSNRRKQEFAVYVIGDFAGAMKIKFPNAVSQLKAIIGKLLKRYMSSILISKNKDSDEINAVSQDFAQKYAKSSYEQAMISTISSIMYYLPSSSLDSTLCDPLTKVLRHVIHTYYNSRKIKNGHFAKGISRLLDVSTKNRDFFPAILDTIVVESVTLAMYRIEAITSIDQASEMEKTGGKNFGAKLSDIYSKFICNIFVCSVMRDATYERKSKDIYDNVCYRWTCTDETYIVKSLIKTVLQTMLKKIQYFDLNLKIIDADESTLANRTFESSKFKKYMLRTKTKEPCNMDDYDQFLNLVNFFVSLHNLLKKDLPAVMYNKYISCSMEWAIPFFSRVLPLSLENHEVSGFYKIIKIYFEICSEGRFFAEYDGSKVENYSSKKAFAEGETTNTKAHTNSPTYNNVKNDDRKQCFESILSYVETVQKRSAQYRDELFVAAANMVLSAPHHSMEYFLKVQTPVLESALTIGLSYRPVAWVAIGALEKWRRTLSDDKLGECLPKLLPKIDKYLLENETEMGKEMNPVKTIEAGNGDTVSLRTYILNFLGRIGGRVHNIVSFDRNNIAKSLRWSTKPKILEFPLLLDNKNAKYGLDLVEILPRVTELAELSGDHDIKRIASETLHTIILYMLPQGNQNALCQIYEKVFPVILRLATDAFDFTRNLFEPLVKQLCHWFSKTKADKTITSPETVTWLNCIVEGASSEEDAALMDISTRALAEFLKWGIKQTTSSSSRGSASRKRNRSAATVVRSTSPVQVNSLMRRIFNMLKTPNAFRQVAAAKTINLFYRDFRENEEIIRRYALDVMFHALNAIKNNTNSSTVSDKKIDAYNSLIEVTEHFAKIIVRRLNDGYELIGESIVNVDKLLEYLLINISNINWKMRSTCTCLFSRIVKTKYKSEIDYSDKIKPDFIRMYEFEYNLLNANETEDLMTYCNKIEGTLYAYNYVVAKGMLSTNAFTSFSTVDISECKKRYRNGETIPIHGSRSHLIQNLLQLIKLKSDTECEEISMTLAHEMFKFTTVLVSSLKTKSTINEMESLINLVMSMLPLLRISIFNPKLLSGKMHDQSDQIQKSGCKLISATINIQSSGVLKTEFREELGNCLCDIRNFLDLTRGFLNMQTNYMASTKISILTGLTLLNRSKIVEAIFETVGKYNFYVDSFFNITKAAFELVDEKKLSPLVMDFYRHLGVFVFEFGADRINYNHVIQMIDKSTYLGYIFATSEQDQRYKIDRVDTNKISLSLVESISSFFMTPEVWKNSSEVLFHNAFRSPRILHVLRQIILRYIFMTDDSDAYGMARNLSFDEVLNSFSHYFDSQRNSWESLTLNCEQSHHTVLDLHESFQNPLLFLQLLTPLVESKRNLNTETTNKFLLDVVSFFLTNEKQPIFELQMESFRLSAVLLKATNALLSPGNASYSSFACKLLQKKIFTHHFPGLGVSTEAGSVAERQNCKAIEVGLTVLKSGGILCPEYFVAFCTKIYYPRHLLRAKIDEQLENIVMQYAKDTQLDAPIRIRASIMELVTSVLLNSNRKFSDPNLKEMVLQKICIPYLLTCEKASLPKIFRTAYKSLPSKQPLFDCLLSYTDATKLGKWEFCPAKYSFCLLQVLYQRLEDYEIKTQIVKLVEGFNSGASPLGKRFANGNEAALTFHIIIQSKKVITLPIEIIDRSCRMAAFVCLCHCVIKTQSLMEKQVTLIFTNKSKKEDKTAVYWRNLIAGESYPSLAWDRANANCVSVICHVFDYFWSKCVTKTDDVKPWAEFDKCKNEWMKIQNMPQPYFMKILLDIGVSTDTSLRHVRWFILHLISKVPWYFKVFKSQWLNFCVSTLVDCVNDSQIGDEKFRSFFMKMTSILTDWHITDVDVDSDDKDSMIKSSNIVLPEATLSLFFNTWLKILAFAKSKPNSELLRNFKVLSDIYLHATKSAVFQLVLDMYIVGCKENCTTSHWLFPSIKPSIDNNDYRWATRLQTFALAVFSLLYDRAEWSWTDVSKVVEKDTLLYDNRIGILPKLFENKHINLRIQAATFVFSISKDKDVLDTRFYETVQRNLNTSFNYHNQADAKKLLEVAVALGPHFCHNREFLVNILGHLTLLNNDNAALVLKVTHSILASRYACVEISCLCLDNLKPLFDPLACQNNLVSQWLLLKLIKLWVTTMPTEQWPKNMFGLVNLKNINDTKNTPLTQSFVDNEDQDICKEFYELCILMDQKLTEDIGVPASDSTSTASSTRQVKGETSYLRMILLRGLKCPFKKVKDTLFEFWDSILPKENVTARALLLVNPNIIDVAVEDNWSQLSSYLMLALVKNSIDYRYNSYLPRCETPLHECDFSDFQVELGSGIGMNMTQSMFVEPAFSTMLSLTVPKRANGASAVQLQVLDMDDNWASQSIMHGSLGASSNDFGEILATQKEDGMLFSLTQQGYSATALGSAPFSSQKSGGQISQKMHVPKIDGLFAVPRPKPKGVHLVGLPKSHKRNINTKKCFRKYRIGELPDTQLKFKDLIDPLLNLCICDKKLAATCATGIFKHALKGNKCMKIIDMLNRDNSKMTLNRDFTFIRNCFAIISNNTSGDASCETRPSGSLHSDDLRVIEHQALRSLNLASGAIAIEDNIGGIDSGIHDDTAWNCLNSIYGALKEDEILDGLKQFERKALDAITCSDNQPLGENSQPISNDFFLKQFFSHLDSRQWKGAQGLVWEGIDRLLKRYASLDDFSFSARHDALSTLPIYISCQDFINLMEQECIGYEAFEYLISTWEKSWPSFTHDSMKTWMMLHETRTTCLNALPESLARERAKVSCLYRIAEAAYIQDDYKTATKYIKQAIQIRNNSNLKKTFNDGYVTARYFFLTAKEQHQLHAANTILNEVEAKFLSSESEAMRQKFYILRGDIYKKIVMISGNQWPSNAESGINTKQVSECIKNTRDSYLSAGGSLGYCALALFDELLLDNLQREGALMECERYGAKSDHGMDSKDRSLAFKELAKSFINNILLAMKFGSNVASNRFSRVLALMADEDAGMDIPSYFKTQVIRYELEAWKFLKFVPLMMAFLNHDFLRMSLCELIVLIARKYPQAVYYDYRIAKESLNLSPNDKNLALPLSRIFQGVPDLIPFADAIIDIATRTKAKNSKDYKVYAGKKILLENDFLLQLLHSSIEIPGQYRNLKTMPLPKEHATIAYIADTMLILKSMRVPKRLTFFGSDAKIYNFLVKSGEDLRNDQRVQQVFETMNGVFEIKASCRKKNLHIHTFSVIPITMRAGMIEWIDNTSPLNNIYGPMGHKGSQKQYEKVSQFIKRHGGGAPEDYAKKFKAMTARRSSDTTFDEYQKMISDFNSSSFRNYLRSLASSSESFIHLRSKIMSSLATINVATDVLGIGDRHLGNFLLRRTDCDIIPIDFGHTFGSATFLLPVPELIPFRNSSQIMAIMAPHPNCNASLHSYMRVAFKAVVSEKQLLLSSMRTYLADPILEWRQKTKSNGSTRGLAQSFASLKIKSQNTSCLHIVKKKLACESPFEIIIENVTKNRNPIAARCKHDIIRLIKMLSKEYNENIHDSLNSSGDDIDAYISQLLFIASDMRVHYCSWVGLALWC